MASKHVLDSGGASAEPSPSSLKEFGGKSWAILMQQKAALAAASGANVGRPNKKSRMNALDHQRDKFELLAKVLLAEEASKTNYWKGAAEGAFESYWKGRYDELAWKTTRHEGECAGVKSGVDTFRLPGPPPPDPPPRPSDLGRNFGPVKTPDIDLAGYQKRARARSVAAAAAAAEEGGLGEDDDEEEEY